jgi:hypothetical protein
MRMVAQLSPSQSSRVFGRPHPGNRHRQRWQDFARARTAGSFPYIQDTLNHLLFGDHFWMGCFTGKQYHIAPMEPICTTIFTRSARPHGYGPGNPRLDRRPD